MSKGSTKPIKLRTTVTALVIDWNLSNIVVQLFNNRAMSKKEVPFFPLRYLKCFIQKVTDQNSYVTLSMNGMFIYVALFQVLANDSQVCIKYRNKKEVSLFTVNA